MGRWAFYGVGVLALTVIVSLLAWLILDSGPESRTLVLSSGSTGGVYQPLAGGVSAAVGREHPHLAVKVVPSHGSAENLSRIEQGEADLAIVQNTDQSMPRVRVLAPLYLEVLHFLKRRDADIGGLVDVRGQRIGIGEAGSGTQRLVRRLLEHYAIEANEFTADESSPNEAVDKLIAGEIDGLMLIAGIRSDAVQRAIDSGVVEFVSFGEFDEVYSEIEGLRYTYPFLEHCVVPRHTYGSEADSVPGEPTQPIATAGVRALLVAREDLPDEVAYEVVEGLFNNRADLLASHRVASQLSERFDESVVQFPLHSGARDFYARAEPGFLVQYAEAMGFVLSAVFALFAVFSAVRAWLARTMKNRIDRYYVALNKVFNQLDANEVSPSELDRLDHELIRIRQSAFEDLIKEKIVADASFSIFQAFLDECRERLNRKRSEARPGGAGSGAVTSAPG